MKILKDIFYNSNNKKEQSLDIYLPEAKSFPVYIYFHGGGLERGIDTRRIIVDEAAPLYHICEKEYPDMLFIVSDNDMKNRLEQTKLVESTLRHFDINKSKYEFLYMENSTHCSYIRKNTPDEKNMFADICIKYILRVESKR